MGLVEGHAAGVYRAHLFDTIQKTAAVSGRRPERRLPGKPRFQVNPGGERSSGGERNPGGEKIPVAMESQVARETQVAG
jgi:hypothetical protein